MMGKKNGNNKAEDRRFGCSQSKGFYFWKMCVRVCQGCAIFVHVYDELRSAGSSAIFKPASGFPGRGDRS
jgi:hypothetical protein